MKLLRLGSTGPDVEALQLALGRIGYYSQQPDGIFGTNTRLAVLRFQNDFGLQPDGIVGALTWAALHPYLTGYSRYTVKPGDTYYKLADEFYTTAKAIAAANPGIDPLNLQPGTVITVPYGFSVVPVNIRITSELYALIIEGLTARYPFIGRQEIGRSVMGRSLDALSIGSGSRELMFNAAHHANEWITTPMLLKFIEDTAKSITQDTYFRAAEFLQNRKLYAVPLVNPDGLDLVTGSLTEGRYFDGARRISASYPAIRFPSGWKANIEGTDLNLNYPAGWELAREIKFRQGYVSPAPRDYVGTTPLSAPESRVMYDFTLSRNFSLTISFHTQGQVIYWKYDGFEPERSREIADAMAAVSGYSVDITPSESDNAGYKDWFIKQYNLPGYTIEMGSGTNPLPLSQFDAIYKAGCAIMTKAIELA